MAFDKSALPAYIEQNKQDLITKTIFGGKTISLIDTKFGIKGSETINIMDTDAIFQNGASCGRSASGTTTFTQVTMTVGDIIVSEDLCPKDLEAVYLQTMLKPGLNEGIPFEQIYAERKVAQINKKLETEVWQNLTSAGKLFNGLLYQTSLGTSINSNAAAFLGTMSTAVGTAVVTGVGTNFTTCGIVAGDTIKIGSTTGIVLTVDSATQITLTANFGVLNTAQTGKWIAADDLATATTSITAANASGIFDRFYAKFPTEILGADDLVIFCGFDVFNKLTQNLKDLNLFHYNGVEFQNFELTLPGTNVKVVAVHGLDSTNRIVGGQASNFVYVTDMLNEQENVDMWWSKDDKIFKFDVEFKAGTQIKFKDQVVQYTNY